MLLYLMRGYPFNDAPTAEQFERAARRVLEQLPTEFREPLKDIVLKVEEFATPDQLESVGLRDPWELSGLYEGRAIPDQTIWASGDMPPVIWLFRQPLLREMDETGVGFEELVRHVVIHEAGHHFGLSDEDMHALEDSVR